MKKYLKTLLVAVLAIFLGSCTTYPEQKNYGKPYPAYASWSHFYFSNFVDEEDVMFRHLMLSDEQGWWGKEVKIYYDYPSEVEHIDTLEGKVEHIDTLKDK